MGVGKEEGGGQRVKGGWVARGPMEQVGRGCSEVVDSRTPRTQAPKSCCLRKSERLSHRCLEAESPQSPPPRFRRAFGYYLA